ncbi:MAG: M24 family metallopeptidase [Pyrinomonadaceae bacterium]
MNVWEERKFKLVITAVLIVAGYFSITAGAIALPRSAEQVEVRSLSHKSQNMGSRDMPYRIVLPSRYTADRTARFPVIYLLHGLTGHFDNWTDKTAIAKYAAERDIIIVTPEGGNGWYSDSVTVADDKFETYIVSDLIPEIDGKFRTLPDRENRAIAGLSMGGYGALKFAIKYPDTFSFAGSFSGALGVTSFSGADRNAPFMKTINAVFGPAGSDSRKENDIFGLIRQSTAEKIRTLPFLYIDCGTEDFLFQNNVEFADLLAEKKVRHEFRQLPGAHTWSYWDTQVQEFLEVADKHFRKARPAAPQATPAKTESSDSGTTPSVRIAEIQTALRAARLNGWLFYDFRGSDILMPRILKIERAGGSRRWFYYIPAEGEPVKVVHAIEPNQLDDLPGKKLIYREWQLLGDQVRKAIGAARAVRVAMQYSPNNDIPYISRVDAGTIEMVRSLGVTVVTSADLVQQFEAVWTPEQLVMHKEAAGKLQTIILEAFGDIKRRMNENIPTTEIDVQQFMMKRYSEEGMRVSPMIVAVNANAASPHYFPTKDNHSLIKRGDLVLIDAVTKLDKPKAPAVDLTWVGYVGDVVPNEYTEIWKIVRRAQSDAFEFVRTAFRDGKPITGAQVDDVARGVIKNAGYADQFLHRTGHSIGEEGHGNGANIDNLETRDSRRLIAGTAFSIEPGIYLKGKFGIRSEIDVYLTGNDAIITAPYQTEIVAIMR